LNDKPEVVVDNTKEVSHNNEAADGREDSAVTAVGTECATSPGTENGYALTDVIDDLMAAEFPETTAPQADSEEVVLLSPTPPTIPPPPPPLSEPELTTGDGVNGKVEDGEERVAAGHQGTHESRVTLSGPLQFMGRNDLTPPPSSPVTSPVKLLDVLPATLRDAAAVEASLGRSVPVTSGSIDAVTLDDTQSPWSTDATPHVVAEVFSESSPSVDIRITGGEDEERNTDDVDPDSVELALETSDVPVPATTGLAKSSNGVSLHLNR